MSRERGPFHCGGETRTAMLERRVMEMYDAHARPVEIAAALDVTVARVVSIISYLRTSASAERAAANAVAAGSARLLAALRRHHPERCGA